MKFNGSVQSCIRHMLLQSSFLKLMLNFRNCLKNTFITILFHVYVISDIIFCVHQYITAPDVTLLKNKILPQLLFHLDSEIEMSQWSEHLISNRSLWSWTFCLFYLGESPGLIFLSAAKSLRRSRWFWNNWKKTDEQISEVNKSLG